MVYDGIDVRIDLAKALAELPEDQARLLRALFENSDLTECEAGVVFGWDDTHCETVSRSLRPDRKHGAAIRKRLAPYKEQKRRASTKH